MSETQPTPVSGGFRRLSGWKEIAQYLGRGTRTAQRWEKEHELPVRRLPARGGRSESVFAFVGEVDEWLEGAAATRARTAEDHNGQDDDVTSEDAEMAAPPGNGVPGQQSPRLIARPWFTAVLGSLVTLLIVVMGSCIWHVLDPL
ncbi:MAG: helix-turn-helix domain-containing protein [Acidobacteriota bacterium]